MPPTEVRPIARRLGASLLLSWAGVQVSGALGSVVVLHLTGSLRWVGLPFVMTSLGSAAAAYPAGRLMDRVGRVPVLVVGHLLAAVGYTVGVLAIRLGSLPLFLGSILLGALGAGAVYLTRLAAADLYPARERGRGLALVVFSASLGALLGIPLLLLAERIAPGLGLPYYAVAWAVVPVVSLGAAAVVATIHPDPRHVALELQAARPDAVAAKGPAEAQVRTVVLAGLALVFAQAAMTCVMSVAGASLEHAGRPPEAIGLTMTAHLVGMFFFSPWIGRFADRRGRRASLALSALLLLAGASGAGFLPAKDFLAPALLVVGVGWSFAFIGATAAIADATPALRRGRVTGLVDVGSALTGSLGALAAGGALAVGGLKAVGLVAAGLALLVAVVGVTAGRDLAGRPRPFT